MPMRLGPGPVFVYESIAATRRWQVYALRTLFVLGLLAGLASVWLLLCLEEGKQVDAVDVKDLAELGRFFYYTIATSQLMLVLIVAPAATAGAVCQDRARGNLTHMLATDLGNAEIVLGKLAARLVPVLALVAAAVPVLALAGLLGGIIIEAILALTMITVAVAVLGCTMAMAVSVRATKTHEVLMAVYGVEFAWVLGPIIGLILQEIGVAATPPRWLWTVNPFYLVWAPYAWPDDLGVEELAGVLGGMMAISAGLTLFAVLRLRVESAGGTHGRAGRWSSRLAGLRDRLASWRPGPSLDGDPVLWREWRRGRPSRLAKVVWGAFILLSLAGTVRGLVEFPVDARRGCDILVISNGLQMTFGLLLLSLAAPTVLAEERVRGSLDVLLATPLSTDRIVLAKWWGAFRVVPALALLPSIGMVIVALGTPAAFPANRRFGLNPSPLEALDRVANVVLPLGLLLAQGAAVTSVGLALATWSRRLGRAVALSVAAYSLVAFLGPILLLLVPELLLGMGLSSDPASVNFVASVVGSACPLGGQFLTYQTVLWQSVQGRGAFYIGQVIVILATLAFALLVLAATMATFNRCVGRVSERPRRAPQPPQPRARRRALHVGAAERRPSGVAEAAMGSGA